MMSVSRILIAAGVAALAAACSEEGKAPTGQGIFGGVDDSPTGSTPTGVTATAPDTGGVSLSWLASTGATSYSVRRSTTAGGPYSPIGTVAAPATTYLDAAAPGGATLYYVIVALTGTVESAPSLQVAVTTRAAGPTGLVATPDPTLLRVTLTWNAVAGASKYTVSRGASAATATVLTDVSAPPYTDATPPAGTSLTYTVKATTGAGTTQASSATALTVPAAPATLTATAGAGTVALSWAASTGAVTYELTRSSSGSAAAVVASPAVTTYTDNVAPSIAYTYFVRAVNATGKSPASPTASATPTIPTAGNVAAWGSDALVIVNWTSPQGATSFTVQRAPNGSTVFTTIGTSTISSYADRTSIVAGTLYQYRVIANFPAGPSAPSPVVTATALGVSATATTTFVGDTGTTNAPTNLRDNYTIAALVPSGATYTTLPGVATTDGNLVIPNVPSGPRYHLRFGDGSNGYRTVVTAGRALDLSEFRTGRADIAPATPTTTGFSIQVTNLNAWDAASNSLELFAAGANDNFTNLEKVNGPTASATAYTANLSIVTGGLIDTSRGDALYLNQEGLLSSSGSTPAGLQFYTQVKSLKPASFVMANGASTPLSGAMAQPTQRMLNVTVGRIAFRARATDVNPAAGVGDDGFSIVAAASSSTQGLFGLAAPVADSFYGTPTSALTDLNYGTIALGNPYGAVDLSLYAGSSFGVSLTAPSATTPLIVYGNIYRRDPLAASTTTVNLQPGLSPPLTPTINGQGAFTDQTAVTVTPTFAWGPPSQQTPTRYVVSIFQLTNNAGATVDSFVARYFTTDLSLKVPPGVLTLGQTYFAFIIARSDTINLEQTPLKYSPTLLIAELITNKFQP